MFMQNENVINVSSEIGTLKRLLIHSPDGGIGKVVPNKFKDWLYDDTVYLAQMRKEYNDYVKLLLYFLDPAKIEYIKDFEKSQSAHTQLDCFKPEKAAYFNSDKVQDTQYLLARVLEEDTLRKRIISAVCATEGCSYDIEKELERIESTHELSKVLISGVLKKGKDKYGSFIFQPVPNFIFTRDISIAINDHLLLSKAATEARERESLLTKYIAYHLLCKEDADKVIEVNESSDFFLLSEEEQGRRKTSLEGGDIMMIAPSHLIVGCSERTTPSGVNKIIHAIFKHQTGIEKISVIKIPEQRTIMHIDTVFTQVRKDVWVLFGKYSEELIHIRNQRKYSYYESLNADEEKEEYEEVEILRFYKPSNEAYDPAKNYKQDIFFKGLEALLKNVSASDYGIPENEVKIIYSGNNVFPYDEREQWTDSCNLLALKNGVAVGYDRNEETLKGFKENGFKVLKAQELFEQFERKILTPADVTDTIIVLPSGELSRARGGAHCMSQPLWREKI
jgi:arginine deiminase